MSLKNTPLKAFIGISLPTLLLFYIPVLFFDFAFSDDYFGLWEYRMSDNWTDAAVNHGRPLQGTIISIIFPWAATVTGLWKIRAIAIIILCSISYMLYKEFLFFYKGDPILAAIFSILPTFVPSLEIITVWPSTFPAIVSLALSLFAGQLLLYKANKKINQFGSIALAFVLLIASLLTYQASVAACLIPWLIRSPRLTEQNKALKALIIPLLIFIISNAIYIIAFKIYQSQASAYIGRSAITDDIGNKISWFFKEPFVLAGSTFATLASTDIRKVALILTSLLFTLAVSLFIKKIGFKKSWWLPILYIVAMPLSYYTNIFAAESFPSYRTQAILTLVFIFGLAMANYELIKEKFRWIGGIALLLIFFIVGAKHFYNDFILLQNHDWKKMVEIVSNNQDKSQINLLRTSRDIADKRKIVARIGMDEFGIPGSAIEWATKPMINIILTDILHKPDTSLTVQIFDQKDSIAYKNIESLIRLNNNFNDY